MTKFNLVFTKCNMLLLTFEQTFTGGVLYDWGVGAGGGSSEKNDFVSEAHLLAAFQLLWELLIGYFELIR